jgi:hypothetical protein
MPDNTIQERCQFLYDYAKELEQLFTAISTVLYGQLSASQQEFAAFLTVSLFRTVRSADSMI